MRRVLAAVVAVAALGGAPAPALAASAQQQAYRDGLTAYVHAYPVLMHRLSQRTFPTNTLVGIDALTRPGDRLVVLPNVDTVYTVAKLDLKNRAPRNALFPVPFRVDRQPGSQGGKAKPNQVEVSHDDGQTWQRVPVLPANGAWLAVIRNPASGFVSLRANAADQDGNTVTQTIIRAYQVS